MPVVENLEDLWKVSKLQTERKKREEEGKVKRLQVGPCLVPHTRLPRTPVGTAGAMDTFACRRR